MPVPAFSLSPPLPRLTQKPISSSPSLLSPSRRPLTATASPAHRTLTSIPAKGYDTLSVSDDLSLRARASLYAKSSRFPAPAAATLANWADNYARVLATSVHFPSSAAATAFADARFRTLLEVCTQLHEKPLPFSSYHERVRKPFDFYKFGLDFTTALIDVPSSRLAGAHNLRRAAAQVAAGENVVFLSNHQSEGDPYAIDVLFDWVGNMDRDFCEEVVFMAGDRVRDDPVVTPFSVGRNLLTVYSKKHINDVPKLRSDKLKHNRRTIASTVALFKEGGTTLWFAPSGGRDRRSKETNCVEVSHFDADAVDVMLMTAKKAGRPTHFYPMALVTYTMFPPPETVGDATLGEDRKCDYGPCHMAIGDEIDFSCDAIAELEKDEDKVGRRRVRAQYVEEIVRKAYRDIGGREI